MTFVYIYYFCANVRLVCLIVGFSHFICSIDKLLYTCSTSICSTVVSKDHACILSQKPALLYRNYSKVHACYTYNIIKVIKVIIVFILLIHSTCVISKWLMMKDFCITKFCSDNLRQSTCSPKLTIFVTFQCRMPFAFIHM